MKSSIIIAFILYSTFPAFNYHAFGQSTKGTIEGNIRDITNNKPLEGVVIFTYPLRLSTISDSVGNYKFEDMPQNTYDLFFNKYEYKTLIIPEQVLLPDTTIEIQAELTKRDGFGEVLFYIGGLEIIAEDGLLPSSIATTTIVKSSDIENTQAISLADILEFLPGYEITNQPSLKDGRFAAIRVPDNKHFHKAFETKIIIDGVPYSNNYDLQGFNAVSGYVTISTGRGIDLREIPVDHIEKVEIIRGVASPKYGDYLAGVINVITKNKAPNNNRLKIKSNPDTKEMNFFNNFKFRNITLTSNLNYAYNLKNIRKEYDNVSRLALSTKFNRNLLNDKLSVTNSFDFHRLFEEIDEDPADEFAEASYNRGYRFIYANTNDFNPNQTLNLHSNLYVNFRKVNSFYKKVIESDIHIISTLMTAGTTTGYKLPGVYVHRNHTNGEEIAIGFEFEATKKIVAFKNLHQITIGSQFQFEDNFGEGFQYKLTEPPNPLMTTRPYNFSTVPSLFQTSFYINNQMSGIFLKNYTLNTGFRCDWYSTGKFDLVCPHNGFYIHPRVNIRYYLTENSHLNFGFGTFSKIPSLVYIYPQPRYWDIAEVIYSESGAELQDSIVTTFLKNRENPELKAYVESKWEMSYNFKLSQLGCSITGYLSKRSGEPAKSNIPITYHRYLYPNYPDLQSRQIYNSNIDLYSRYTNNSWSEYNGLEISLKTHTLQKINANFSLEAGYHFSKQGIDNLRLKNPSDLIYPFYKNDYSWYQKLVMTLRCNYILKSAGIWIATTIHHVPFYHSKKILQNNGYPVAYYDGNIERTISIPTSEVESYAIYQSSIDENEYKIWKYPSKWLFNFRLCKSILKNHEISIVVNNIFNDRAYYKTLPDKKTIEPLNPELFYSVEFSSLF